MSDDILDGFGTTTTKVAKRTKKDNTATHEHYDDGDEDDYHDDNYNDEDEDEEQEGEKATMFELDQIELPITDADLKQFIVSDGTQLSRMDDNRIAAYDGDKVVEYEVPRHHTIHRMFLDPLGAHVLVSTDSGKTYYANTTETDKAKKKLVECEALKNLTISAVGWDKRNASKSVSGSILLGTSTGGLVETRLEAGIGAKNSKVVYDLDTKAGDDSPITGLEVERFPKAKSKKMLVLVTTPTRMYQFVGGPSYELLFDGYQQCTGYREMPANNTNGDLVLWHNKGVAKTFAWITGVGILHGRLKFANPVLTPHRYQDEDFEDTTQEEENIETVVTDTHIIPYLYEGFPISVVITEYHFYICYTDKLLVVGHPPGLSWTSTIEPYNKLKKQDLEDRLDFNANLAGRGKGIGLYRDAATGDVYVFTAAFVYQIFVDNEERDVWRQFLDRALDVNEREREAYFKKSLKLCQGDRAKEEQVLCARGDYHYQMGEFHEAAKVYAKTNRSFEETSLKFIEVSQPDALMTFLLARLSIMQARSADTEQERTQFTCLCTWVVEMYLDRLNHLTEDEEQAQERDNVSAQFQKFLQQHRDNLDMNTTFNLISGHGQIDEVLYFAELMRDYKRVITHHIISRQNYTAAIDVLKNHCTKADQAHLWYQFSPVLIQHFPAELVDGWIDDSVSDTLNPSHLIPALVKYNIKQHNAKYDSENHAIRYLKWLIEDRENIDMSMHNMLLSFYAKEDDQYDLLDFLQTSEYYDPKYGLRLCLDCEKEEACVHIYSQMGLYEDAVRTALKIGNVKLAKANADTPQDDDISLKKKLWLQIAKFVGEKNVKDAIELLKHTEYIKLEDILPFFRDHVKIQDFKSEICQSLEDYNVQIQQLRSDMDDATGNAENIRQCIKDLRHRYGYITATQPCDICKQPALSRDFYIFPICRHVFHKDCLQDHLRDILNPDEMYEDFETLVSGDCAFCSDFMIRTIDKEFCTAEEAEAWAIRDD